ncbi:Interferon-induced 44 family [Micractinium conductrix]|uniref:Interferon-induced 44 family n=1 Tax=Micractinium conductrix TaxID=554055 RepID=A0A2P6VPQ5_9CHLO|nr:Interferon-induced 44 family [Micractinium conductrix]|eukprot:PSC76035.1 Interferon-induced 44 family [Micractinium conductrix]
MSAAAAHSARAPIFKPQGTALEGGALSLTYDADRDGWSPEAFHAAVDGRGPAIAVALTATGEILGGYNPAGWQGQGQEVASDEAYLFFFPENGDLPVRLPKVGGPGEAVFRDEPKQGLWFGRDGLVVPLSPGSERAVKSKLGAYYSRKPDGARHLISDGVPVKGGSRGCLLASLHVWTAAA